MKRNFFALLMLLAMVIGAISLAFAETKGAAESGSQVNQLAARLPNSDGVVMMDMQRLMNEGVPQILSGNLPMLNEVNVWIDRIKTQFGVDLRQFDQIAAGLTVKQSAPGKFDFEPIVLARGKINTIALFTTATTVAKGKFREEKAGAKTIYVFAVKEILQANKPVAKTPQDEEEFNQMLNRAPAEIAAATLDNNTLVIGLPARVRETVEAKSRISPNILALASRKPNSIISFGGNVPAGLSQIWNMEGDDLGKTIDSIRQISGAMNMNDGNAAVSLIAKTAQAPEAKTLHETLQGFQELGIGLLGGMKGEDKKVYARLAQNAKITLANSEVMLDVQVSQNDINVLLGKN
jgi:hypothetical protein